MTLRSKPRENCAHCKGSGIVSVSKDPDEVADCVCTDPPRRVQLYRQKGWRKPENTVVVARPTRWGNPFQVVDDDRKRAVSLFERSALGFGHFTPDRIRAELAGKNLACWCPLDQPCHADVLLELANGGAHV